MSKENWQKNINPQRNSKKELKINSKEKSKPHDLMMKNDQKRQQKKGLGSGKIEPKSFLVKKLNG
jgi:hypothetical protein